MTQHNETVLEEAARIVSGQRQQEYGPIEDNFSRIAMAWQGYLNVPICALDIAMMLILLKVMRHPINSTTAKRDTLVDIGGYTACAAKIAQIDPNDTHAEMRARNSEISVIDESEGMRL